MYPYIFYSIFPLLSLEKYKNIKKNIKNCIPVIIHLTFRYMNNKITSIFLLFILLPFFHYSHKVKPQLAERLYSNNGMDPPFNKRNPFHTSQLIFTVKRISFHSSIICHNHFFQNLLLISNMLRCFNY